MEVIIEEFSLPEEIAAVTLIGAIYCFVSDLKFVAFGSSTPEILLNTISAVNKASSLSMPALLGSGFSSCLYLIIFSYIAMIAFGLIPSVCILYNKRPEVILETGPIAREVVYFSSIFNL